MTDPVTIEEVPALEIRSEAGNTSLKIMQNGDVEWRGTLIQGPEEFRTAVLDFSQFIVGIAFNNAKQLVDSMPPSERVKFLQYYCATCGSNEVCECRL